MAPAMPVATWCGFAQSGPFGKAAVMGVSTNPGLIVITATPLLDSLCLRPDRKAVTSACHRGDYGDRPNLLALEPFSNPCEQCNGRNPVVRQFLHGELCGTLAGLL